MASKQTANYGLSQWEATDQVVRVDFNTDNAKIDAEIKAARDAAESAQETADAAVALGEAAYSDKNSPIVAGWYIGNEVTPRTISLGFTPRAVLVVAPDGVMGTEGGLAVTGQNAAYNSGGATSWVTANTRIAIVESGFQVGYSSNAATNAKQAVYNYIALR